MIGMRRYFNGQPRLCFTDTGGNHPILLLLHGVTRCGDDWAPILQALSCTWRVVAIDHRGHGESAPADSYLVNDYVADAIHFVKEVIASPLTIMGHSLGAMVAAAVAAKLPELVRSIVLEDPPFHTMGNKIAGTPWQALFIGMREVALLHRNITESTDLLSDIQLPKSDGSFQRLGDVRDRASLTWNAQCLSKLDPEVLTPIIEGRWLDDYIVANLLPSIHCPTLLLQADPTAGRSPNRNRC